MTAATMASTYTVNNQQHFCTLDVQSVNQQARVLSVCNLCANVATQMEERVQKIMSDLQPLKDQDKASTSLREFGQARISEYQFFSQKLKEIAAKSKEYAGKIDLLHHDVDNCLRILNTRAQEAGLSPGLTECTLKELTEEQNGKQTAMRVIKGSLDDIHTQVTKPIEA